MFDAEGRLTHHVSVQSDVTGHVLASHERDAARAEADQARLAQALAEEAGRFGRLLLTMSEALTATTTVAQIAATVTDVLAPELGAASGGLLVADAARTHLDFVTTAAMPADLDGAWARIRWDEDAPLAAAVRSRQTLFYPDVASIVAAHPSVADHDITAAAHMGQLRGLLRAFAFDRVEPPAEVVGRLDRAVDGLNIAGLATLVLARVEQPDADARQGLRTLRWTNAGHPPPILLHADGTTEILGSRPELLIGVRADLSRSDHTHVLPEGSTLLLYTDGLIEHRGRDLDEGIADLRRALTASTSRSLDELLDHLLTELVGDAPDDDCALLAVRAHPENQPRPPEAGPSRV